MSEAVVIRTTIPAITLAVKRALQEVVDETTQQAKDNIEFETYRAHHGRIYPSRREPGAMHQASAPGESFASDTGSLVSTMKIHKLEPLTNELQLQDGRWAIFEFGGGRIAPRPTVTPVFEHMQPKFAKDCTDAVIDAATREQLTV